MPFRVITQYEDLEDLKKKIINQYLFQAQAEAKMWQEILADKTWAPDKDVYHKKCRSDAKLQVDEYKKQIKLLTNPINKIN